MNFYRVNNRWGYPSKVAPVEMLHSDERRLEHFLGYLGISVEVVKITGHWDEFLLYSEDWGEYNRARHELYRTYGNVTVRSLLPVPSREEFLRRIQSRGEPYEVEIQLWVTNPTCPRFVASSSFVRMTNEAASNSTTNNQERSVIEISEAAISPKYSETGDSREGENFARSFKWEKYSGGQAWITLREDNDRSVAYNILFGDIRGIKVDYPSIRIGFQWIIETDGEWNFFKSSIPTIQDFTIKECRSNRHGDPVLISESEDRINIYPFGQIDLETASNYGVDVGTTIQEPLDFGDDPRLFWNRPSSSEGTEFKLNEVDLVAIEIAQKELRTILTHPRISPEQIVIIGKALKVLDCLPALTDDFYEEIGISYKDPFQGGYSNRGLNIVITGTSFAIQLGGYDFNEGVGHDTVSEPGYELELGYGTICECDLYGLEGLAELCIEKNGTVFVSGTK